MDQIRKWTFYLIILVAGFAMGIGTVGLFPQMWLKYGINGLLVHIAFLAVLTYLAILEAENVMKSGYYFTELYTKISQKPGMILAILTVNVIFLSYYTANTALSILVPVLGTGTVARLVAKLVMIILVGLIITRAKDKTFAIMAIGALILVFLVPLLTLLFKTQIASNAEYLNLAWNMLVAKKAISAEMIRAAADRALYGVGLGFGFYIMLGSFMNERFNARLIIGTGVFLQLILGILSTFAVIYAVTPSDPDLFIKYAGGGEEAAIELMGSFPKILSNHSFLLAVMGLTIFMAGLTSLLPTAEVGVQIIESTFRMGRSRAALYLLAAVAVVGVFDSPPSIADVLLKGVTTSLAVTAIFEAYPLISGTKKPKTAQLAVIGTAVLLFVLGFITQSYYDAKLGGAYYISIVLAIFVAALGFLGEGLLPGS
ncbi:hypothetical protein A3L09_03080 [Thermococcus profundus]|uniref:Amino acid permease n=1 Tax=Thermococcus profundus TaxID=49899 RepID=A0A2Z2M7E1_THEPR|nr:sodium-dependent transporter [Thermococcus profundus]ASJ02310.1 hypothetical protein A3L09_03080 [Thermococcus profundus]